MKLFAAILMLALPCAGAGAPPSAPPAPNHLQNAIALRDAGRIAEAVAEFARAGVQIAPDGIQMFYSEYASRQWNSGHIQSAIDAYRDGIKAAPNGMGAGLMHYDLASLFYNKTRYAEAVPEFQAATHTAYFNNAWTWLLLGTSLHKLGRDGDARDAWQQAAASSDPWRTNSRAAARRELKHLRSHI